MRPANEQGKPVPIVCPHLIVGNCIERRPERDGFLGLLWFPFEIAGEKDGAMQAVAVPELEMQFAVRFGPERFDTEFLKGLAQGRLPGRLARIDLAAGPVDLARSETALLADEQNLFLPHDEEEIGADARLPG